MSRLDEIKADIAFHEKVFILATTIAVALIGWIFGHLDAPVWQVATSVFCALFATGFSFRNYRLIKKLIKELRDV